MLRKKNITLNDKKASGNEILKKNDSIKIYFSDETLSKFHTEDKKNTFDTGMTNNKKYPLDILYEDDDILVVNKPAGILSQKASKEDYSVNDAVLDYCFSNYPEMKKNGFKPAVCNRLDRNTSGIILAGKSIKGLQHLSTGLKDRSFKKYYYTIVSGDFKSFQDKNNDKGYFCAYISKDDTNNKSYIISSEDYNRLGQSAGLKYKKIENEFEIINSNARCSLIKVKLITGKSHQIRAHLAYLGFSVIGDFKYGNPKDNAYFKQVYQLKEHLLHAALVSFTDLSDNMHEIEAEMPEKMKLICTGEGLI